MDRTRWTWIELACTVGAPTIVLIFGTRHLGPVLALIVALAFPLGFAVASLVREGKPSALSVLSLVSVLLTGGVGLLALDPRWFALKEALIPAAFGVVIIGSAQTRSSAVGVVLDRLLDPERTAAALARSGGGRRYDEVTRNATRVLGLLTIASGVASFVLARWMVSAPAGTEAFNGQLGSYTFWSFVVVSLPVMGLSFLLLQRALTALEAALGEPLDGLLRAG
ncbi:MAG: VC0807 family protein [Myxococcota bacterium]